MMDECHSSNGYSSYDAKIINEALSGDIVLLSEYKESKFQPMMQQSQPGSSVSATIPFTSTYTTRQTTISKSDPTGLNAGAPAFQPTKDCIQSPNPTAQEFVPRTNLIVKPEHSNLKFNVKGTYNDAICVTKHVQSKTNHPNEAPFYPPQNSHFPPLNQPRSEVGLTSSLQQQQQLSNTNTSGFLPGLYF